MIVFEENFDKDGAYKDIDKIADFINNLQHENKVLKRALEKCFTSGVGFIKGLYDEAIQQAEKEVSEDDR